MRSFSGLYFILRVLPYTYIGFGIYNLNLHLTVWSYTAFLFFTSTLLTANFKPYKHTYMNVLDTLLLANITIVCYLLSRDYDPDESVEITVALLMPATVFVLCMAYRVFQPAYFIIKKNICHCWKLHWSKIKASTQCRDTDYDESNQVQPLLAPTFSIVGIDSSDNNEQYTI